MQIIILSILTNYFIICDEKLARRLAGCPEKPTGRYL